MAGFKGFKLMGINAATAIFQGGFFVQNDFPFHLEVIFTGFQRLVFS